MLPMSSTWRPSCFRRVCRPATLRADGPMSTPRRLAPRSICTPILRIFSAICGFPDLALANVWVVADSVPSLLFCGAEMWEGLKHPPLQGPKDRRDIAFWGRGLPRGCALCRKCRLLCVRGPGRSLHGGRCRNGADLDTTGRNRLADYFVSGARLACRNSRGV